jgi:hypothetical protein
MFVIKVTDTSGGMQTKPSINPKEISICDCKEMLMGTVNDAIEILADVGAEYESEIFSMIQRANNNCMFTRSFEVAGSENIF